MPPSSYTNYDDGENPLMALVDAAERHAQDGYDGSSSDASALSSDESSRPTTPPASESSSSASVSPTSVVSAGNSLEESLRAKKVSFPEQLATLLDDDKLSDVLTWMPDGKAFTIVDPKRFTKEHMPQVFNIRNMSSFVRKLTRWGFSRLHEQATMNSDIFKHPEFQRGNIEKCREIKCGGRSSTTSPTSPFKCILPSSIVSGSPRMPSSSTAKNHSAHTPPPSRTMTPPMMMPPLQQEASASSAALKSTLDSIRRNSDPFLERFVMHQFLERQQSLRLAHPTMHHSWMRAPAGIAGGWSHHYPPHPRPHMPY